MKNTEYFIRKGVFFSKKSEIKAWVENRLKDEVDDFFDPLLLKGMVETVKVIRNSVKLKKRIVIFSDYDADGITGGVIMFQGLKKITKNVALKMSHRSRGYGISIKDIQEIYSEDANTLIITVDNGIKAFGAINMSKELGMDIVVTDHHSLAYDNKKNEMLPDCVVVNPLQKDCAYPNKDLSGACIALKVIHALLGEDFKQYLYLAAISIVSDVVSVLGENRLILKAGLKQMRKRQLPEHVLVFFKEANEEMKKLKNKDKDFFLLETIDEFDIGFYIAPLLNATGRLYSPDIASDALMGKVPARKVVEINLERQEKTKSDLALIEGKIRKSGCLAFVFDNVQDGLAGIIAGRIKEFYEDVSFTVVLFPYGENMAKGSIRSDDVNVEKILSQCTDIIISFGGHKGAAGLTINIEKIDSLYERLSVIVNQKASKCKKQYIDLPLKNDSLIDLELASWISSLSPFGIDNPKPLIMTELSPKNTFYLGDGSHVKFLLKNSTQAIFFSGREIYMDMGEPNRFKAVGHLTVNEYNEKYTPSLDIKKIKHV